MTFSFSLNKLKDNLISQPNKKEYVSLPGEEIKATTIRLEPAVRKFCDEQAAKLGTSIQSFIAMILKAVLLETTQPVKSEALIMYERFIEICQSQNIATADIPNILKKFNISLSILVAQEKLLDKFTPELFEFLKDTFSINIDWLKGKSNEKFLT